MRLKRQDNGNNIHVPVNRNKDRPENEKRRQQETQIDSIKRKGLGIKFFTKGQQQYRREDDNACMKEIKA